MQTRMLGLVLTVVFCAGLSPAQPPPSPRQTRPGPPPPPPVAAGTSSLAGRVADAQAGSPIAAATVRIFDEARRTREIKTSVDGAFAFTGIADGTYRVYAEAPKYASGGHGVTKPFEVGELVTLAPNQKVDDILIKLNRGGVIKGRALDESGEAVPTVAVTAGVASRRNPNTLVSVVPGVRADEQGYYELVNLPSGDWLVSAQGNGRQIGMRADDEMPAYLATFFPGVTDSTAATPVHIEPGVTVADVNFALRRTVAYSLRVPVGLDAVDGSTVEIVLASADGRSVHRGNAKRIGTDGLAGFYNLKPGTYVLWVRGRSASGYLAGMREIALSSNMLEPPLTLEAAAAISGRVAAGDDASAVPVGIRVAARLVQVTQIVPFPVDDVEVAADGRFALTGLFGRRRLDATGLPAGWSIRGIVAGGQELPPDTVIDLQVGQTLADVVVIVGPDQ